MLIIGLGTRLSLLAQAAALYCVDGRLGSDRSKRWRGVSRHSYRPGCCRVRAGPTQQICGPEKMVDFLNRREFIGATAVAGASMLLNSCKSDSAEKTAAVKTSSLNTINIALIGYGEEGKILLESLLNIEGVRLVALCDIWDYHRNEGVAIPAEARQSRSALTKITRTCLPRKKTCRRS